ncbi:MAG: hypothetical protein RR478_01945 [Bacilli bacterium]
MECNWNINDLKKLYRKLYRLFSRVNNKEKEKMKETLNTLKVMIEDLSNNGTKEIFYTLSFEEKVYCELEYASNFTFMWDDVIELNKKKLHLITPEVIEVRNMVLTNDDILTLVHDFYKTMDKDIYQLFLKAFRERKNHLRFSETKTYDMESYMFYLPFIDKAYIEICNYKNYETLPATIHEYGHVIELSNKQKSGCNYHLLVFSEIVSTFFELIANYYFNEFPEFKNDAFEEQKAIFNTTLLDAHDLGTEFDIFNRIQEFDPQCGNHLKSYLANKHNINKNTLQDIFDSSIAQNLQYTFAVMLAVELFEIFKVDSDKAFYLLKEYMKLPENDPFIYYEKIKGLGIIPNQSIESFARSLER